jgi:hypothetical protein
MLRAIWAKSAGADAACANGAPSATAPATANATAIDLIPFSSSSGNDQLTGPT